MKAHFTTVFRNLLPLVALSALMSSLPVQAADGCTVLLCLVGNWRNISVCRPPVEEMMRDVERGRHFPACDTGGSSAASNLAIAASECPVQYRTESMTESAIDYQCPFTSVIGVAVEGQPWSRTWWSASGDSVTEWLPAARAAFASRPTEIDERFVLDLAAWTAAKEAARVTAKNAALPAGGGE